MINYKDEYIKKCYEFDMALNEARDLKAKLNKAANLIELVVNNINGEGEGCSYIDSAREFLKELNNES